MTTLQFNINTDNKTVIDTCIKTIQTIKNVEVSSFKVLQ